MPNKTPSPASSPPPPPNDVIRLMLHTEDGMIPYLTPDMLQQFFPPVVPTLWCLGIAVNETCITPIYNHNNNNNNTSTNGTDTSQNISKTKQKKKMRLKKRAIEELLASTDHIPIDNNDDDDDKIEPIPNDKHRIRTDITTATTAAAPMMATRKPRGYKFSSTGGSFEIGRAHV